MAIYGAFSSAMLGMMSQSKALHSIGVNVANVNTGGYKGTTTQFSTLLSRSVNNVSDNGGVRPTDKMNISKQGFVVSSQSSTDVAINGKGFFMMNTQQDGLGGELYGRDGSFEIKTDSDISVLGNNGQTITTKDGYLADKNGYFIQGWAYQNGVVSTAGTPQSLRVDQFAFLNQFDPTTTASLGLNLPAGDAVGAINPFDITVYDSLGAAQSVKLNFIKTGTGTWNVTATNSRTPVAQVDTLTLAGTPGEAGDTYTASVNGNSVMYTTTGAETSIDDIRNGLMALINTNPQIAANATATAGAAGQIVITATTAGSPLTTTVAAAQGPVVDVAQTDSVTLAGGVGLNDTFSVTINGITLTETQAGADTLSDLRDRLIVQINGHATLAPLVTASPNAVAPDATINLVSDTAGVAYTVTAAANDVAAIGAANTNTVTAGTANVTAFADNTNTVATTTANVTNTVTTQVTTASTPAAQVDTMTLTGAFGAAEVGDTYTATVNGNAVTYTATGAETSIDDIRNGLMALINGSSVLNADVTATAGAAGAITLTSNTPGIPITTAIAATNGGATADNAGTVATTTANVSTITFGPDGTVTSPTDLNLNLTFNGGGTATVALDISNTTQFYGEFLPVSYTKNGYASSSMRSFNFNTTGDVIGTFEDNTNRTIYKLALAVFANPNALEATNGNVFKTTNDSGAATITSASAQGYASITPNARELSNIDLATEFTRMMTTQTAYNAASKVFSTADEMLTVARDLKR